MVKIINKSVCRGVAGRRNNPIPYGIVIHNTADNATAEQHMNRLASYNNAQLENGFAHYFIDENTIIRTEDTYNMAWHTANSDGNANYVGYEVCRSTGDEKTFLQAEQNTFMQAAQDFKEWGKIPNRDNVRLHKEFVATACPHRSWDLHGKSINAVKDYYISQIKKYMTGSNTIINESNGIKAPRMGLWYRGHVAEKGWLNYMGSEATAGTTGQNRRLEAIEVLWDKKPDSIRSSYHTLNEKWTDVPKGITGTTGKAQAIDQVCFASNQTLLNTGRRIQYRVHSESIGWGPWKEEGGVAGTKGKKIEAIQMRMTKNGIIERG